MAIHPASLVAGADAHPLRRHTFVSPARSMARGATARSRFPPRAPACRALQKRQKRRATATSEFLRTLAVGVANKT